MRSGSFIMESNPAKVHLGGLAQLVERLVCTEKVRSSNLLASKFSMKTAK